MRHTPFRSFPARHTRSASNLHVRQARASDLPSLASFAVLVAPERGARLLSLRPRRGSTLTDLLFGAWCDRDVCGLVWCDLRAHPRLRWLLVPPGPKQVHLERWLLRRLLQGLRALGAGALDFSSSRGSDAPVCLVDPVEPLRHPRDTLTAASAG